MLVPIVLSGILAKRFGKRFYLAVSSPREAVRALCSQLPGFEQALLDHPHGFRVWADNELIQNGSSLDICTGTRRIRIVPMVAGAKSGFTSIILGAALIWASSGTYGWGEMLGGTIAGIGTAMGVSMVLGGLSQLLTSAPAAATSASNDSNLLFSGAINTTAQGNPVAICYGHMRVGSQVISAGIESVQMPYSGAVSQSPGLSTNGGGK